MTCFLTSSPSSQFLFIVFVLGDKHYCPGFYDKHGIWNNGFYCPMWGTADTKYCCGVETSRYCCQRPEDREASGSSDTP